MRKRWALITAVMLLAGAARMHAQGDSLEAGSMGTTLRVPRVTVAPVPPVVTAPGKVAPLAVDFRVEPGFHVNSNRPRDEFLKPTMLRLSPPTNIMVGKVTYPPGKNVSFPFMPGQILNVYSGDFRVKGLVTPARTVSPGTYRVHGTLQYQACDNRQCYPPRELPVQFDVKVKTSTTKATHRQRRPGQSPHVR